MKTLSFSILAAAAACGLASAQTAYTTPVGYNTVTCPSNSDTNCSVPFNSEVTFAGTTSIPIDLGSDTHSLVLSANPNLNLAAGFAYYITFKSGARVGEYYEIVNKTLGATIVVDDRGVDLTTVANGTLIDIKRFWTLQTLFPDGNTTITPSTGTLSTQRRTQILIPSLISGVINIAPQQTFFFNNPTLNWRSTASGNPVSDDVILWPDTYFVIRHTSVTGPTTYSPSGTVEEGTFTQPLFTHPTTSTDNFVAIPRPINVRLDQLGLGDAVGASPAFVASTGTLSTQRGDTILVFNNALALQNKAPSATYYYLNTDKTWRSTAAGAPISSSVELSSSAGFIIRKRPALGGATVFWTNNKNW